MRMRSFWSQTAALVLIASLSGATVQAAQSTDTQDTTERETQVDRTTRQRAEQWDLSVEDWHRYETLQRGIDGYRSDKLDPITLLGMHARTSAERAHYAKKLVRLEHERVERLLAFQNAYDRAWDALYPDELPVEDNDTAGAIRKAYSDAQRLGLDDGARKSVIVRIQDCAACRQTVKQLASSHTPMDIYLIDADSDDAIRSWASRLGLDAARVRAGEITLNHAPETLSRRLADASLPRVLD